MELLRTKNIERGTKVQKEKFSFGMFWTNLCADALPILYTSYQDVYFFLIF